jgi:hypothetical protein
MMIQAVFQTEHYYFLQQSPPDGLPQLSSRPQQVFPRGRAGMRGIETTESFFSSSALPQCTHTASPFEAWPDEIISLTFPQDLHSYS